MTIRKSTPATDNATTLISEEKKDSGIESVGVVVGSDLRDDCMTAEVKAEDEEVKAEDDWDDKGCDGKIGFGEGSVIVVVVVWEFAMLWVIVEKLFVIVVVGIVDWLWIVVGDYSPLVQSPTI